jgi:hypothetical protein
MKVMKKMKMTMETLLRLMVSITLHFLRNFATHIQ